MLEKTKHIFYEKVKIEKLNILPALNKSWNTYYKSKIYFTYLNNSILLNNEMKLAVKVGNLVLFSELVLSNSNCIFLKFSTVLVWKTFIGIDFYEEKKIKLRLRLQKKKKKKLA